MQNVFCIICILQHTSTEQWNNILITLESLEHQRKWINFTNPDINQNKTAVTKCVSKLNSRTVNSVLRRIMRVVKYLAAEIYCSENILNMLWCIERNASSVTKSRAAVVFCCANRNTNKRSNSACTSSEIAIYLDKNWSIQVNGSVFNTSWI